MIKIKYNELINMYYIAYKKHVIYGASRLKALDTLCHFIKLHG